MTHATQKALVALLSGGYSPEGACALSSAWHIHSLFKEDEHYQTYIIQISREGWFYEDPNNGWQRAHIDRNDFSLTLSKEGKIKFDLAVLLIGGEPGEDGQIQGYLQMSNVPFVGCGLLASAMTFDKSVANRMVRSFNSSMIYIAPSVDVFRSESADGSAVLKALDAGHFHLPLFVKPADSGSSLGTAKVTETSQLTDALNFAFKESNHALVEQFIQGRELTVGVAKVNGVIRVFPITEIVPYQPGAYFDIQTKFDGNEKTQFVTPAALSEETKKRVEAGVSEVYAKFNLSGLVRIDLILEMPSEKVFFLEVNSAPSQAEYSIIMKQLALTEWAGDKRVEFYKQLFREVHRV